ncbi:MAG: peptide deformylase [Clostridia bacterium]|nr:peptide deformylase [Clostridia bacterium]MBQ7289073.1 peptide deformylase [Clostridia bacterium]
MAMRNIVHEGDDLLRKKCRTVEVFDEKLAVLIDDMLETMYAADGVGLAAPQVGILKRVCVIDIGEGPIELVNPVITVEEGQQISPEACLSCPGRCGTTKRPNYVQVKAQDRHGNPVTYEGTELLAKAFCHEIDHLDGILFIDIMLDELEEE